LQVVGGTPGVGKILTSDAVGNATWQMPQGGGNNDNNWLLTGNAGTVDGVNFIGTTDNVPFNIRVNNEKAGRIDHLKFNTFYGYQVGNSNTTGTENTANGHQSLNNNTEGSLNTSNGAYSLWSNTTGNGNIAVGYGALQANSSGNTNSAVGTYALWSNTTGFHNTATGSGPFILIQQGL
jgi:hypothetical protein